MKYPKMATALGWTEVPDMAEGIFLQPEEAAKIERDLSTGTGSISPSEITTRDKRIRDLEAEVVSLRNGSGKDAKQGELNGTINNPEHPLNQLADLATGKGSRTTKKLRCYLSGTNLLTFTKVKEFDPESQSPSGLPYYYPVTRLTTVGVNLTF